MGLWALQESKMGLWYSNIIISRYAPLSSTYFGSAVLRGCFIWVRGAPQVIFLGPRGSAGNFFGSAGVNGAPRGSAYKVDTPIYFQFIYISKIYHDRCNPQFAVISPNSMSLNSPLSLGCKARFYSCSLSLALCYDK